MGSVDKYVYPGTNVLINLFDCHDGLELEKLEALSTGANLATLHGCSYIQFLGALILST